MIRLLAAALIISGCDASQPGAEATFAARVSAAVCSLTQFADADCDGILDGSDLHPGVNDWLVDTDGDTAPDPIDRYAGDDYGDDDGDGWSNWFDSAPLDRTVAEMIARANSQDQVQIAQGLIEATATERGLAPGVSALEVLATVMTVQGHDRDGDLTLDAWDTQATLDARDDWDGDGESNGGDLFPGDPADY
jgi:hypothetical protein